MSANSNINPSLASRQCVAATTALSQEQVNALLPQLNGWLQQGQVIGKTLEFKNYYQTMSFVNAVAWIANREDHHPDLSVSYNKCKVEYSTHAVNGLSNNDFICAAKVDALLTV